MCFNNYERVDFDGLKQLSEKIDGLEQLSEKFDGFETLRKIRWFGTALKNNSMVWESSSNNSMVLK